MASLDRSIVANVPILAGLNAGDLDTILRDARSVRYPKDSACSIRAPKRIRSSFCCTAISGSRRPRRKASRSWSVTSRRASYSAWRRRWASRHYPATAIAVVDSVALSWPSKVWPQLIAKFPALAAGALQTVGGRLQDTQARVLEMSCEQVEQRVAHALLRLAKQAGRKVEQGVEIDFPISRQDVAEMTGTTLHTVSRILSAWEQQGLVEGGRQRIVLRDPHSCSELRKATAKPDGERR